MLFTPLPSTPKSKRFIQSTFNEKEGGVIVDVTQKKTQKINISGAGFSSEGKISVVPQEDTEDFQWDTQMLRDVEMGELEVNAKKIKVCETLSDANDVLPRKMFMNPPESKKNFFFEMKSQENIQITGPDNRTFKTALGNQVKSPSEKSFLKAKSLFSDEVVEESVTIKSHGFQTAAGGKLQPPSDASLKKISNMFDEVSNEPENLLRDGAHKGFVSALGRNLKTPSNGAIYRAKQILNEETGKEINVSNAPGNGFITASGSKLKPPSEKSSSMAKKLLHDGVVEDSRPIKSLGFQSAAGGKLQSPSEESLMKISNMFDEVSNVPENVLSDASHKEFVSALGKKLKLPSNEAINRAKQLLDEETGRENNISNAPVNGFMTASGSKVKPPSGKSLNMAKHLFNDELEMNTNLIVLGSEIKGFVSGSGKTINVTSKEALKKSKRMFTDACKNVSNGNAIPAIDLSVVKDVNKSNVDYTSCDNIKPSSKIKHKTGDVMEKGKEKIMVTTDESRYKEISVGDVKDTRKCNEDEKHLTSLYGEIKKLIAGNDMNPIESIALQIARMEEKKTISEKLKKNWHLNRVNKTTLTGILLTEKTNINKCETKLTLQKLKKQYSMCASSLHEDNITPATQYLDCNATYYDSLSLLNHRFYIKTNKNFATSDAHRIIQSMTIPIGKDGATIICQEDCTVGITEITSSFMACSDIDPKLLFQYPEVWIRNHYRWICWKLLSLERRFPKVFGRAAFLPSIILDQLRLRYDREVEKSERSALKLIYEGDASPSQGLVLCVASIEFIKDHVQEEDSADVLLELTDGWYSITCILSENNPLLPYLDRKISIGTKIITFGAELLNLSQPCSPLEAPTFESLLREYHTYANNKINGTENNSTPTVTKSNAGLREIISKYPVLKLSPNSTRRAKWDCKMGFYFKTPTMTIPFSSLLNNGGYVSEVWAEIVRQYPLVYKHVKASLDVTFGSNSSSIFINEKVYERNVKLQSIDKHKIAEDIYLEVQKEFEINEYQEKKERQRNSCKSKNEYLNCKSNHLSLNETQVKMLSNGEEINDAIELSLDPASVEYLLSAEQCQMLQEFKQIQKEEKESLMKAEVHKRINERVAVSGVIDNSSVYKQNTSIGNINVDANSTFIPILRLRVADIYQNPKHRKDSVCTGTIQIWRPTEEMLMYLKEGKRFRFLNLTSNIVREGEVQFRATKSTRFHEILDNIASKNSVGKYSVNLLTNSSVNTSFSSCYRRKLTHIDEIISRTNFNPEFREVDIVGILVQVGQISAADECRSQFVSENIPNWNKRRSSKKIDTGNIWPPFETIYVCDTSLNFVAIKFWKAVQEFGYEKVINDSVIEGTIKSPAGDTKYQHTILYIKNLQWRPFSSQEIMVQPMDYEPREHGRTILPSLFVTEQTEITKNPSEPNPSKFFEEIQVEVGAGLEGAKFIDQARLRLRKLLSGINAKIPYSPTISNRKYPQTSPVISPMPNNPQISGRTLLTTPDDKQFRVPRNSPSTPLSYRQRKEELVRPFDCENFLVKGNVKVVPGSPAEMQSKKTQSRMKALEQAAIKLTYWNP